MTYTDLIFLFDLITFVVSGILSIMFLAAAFISFSICWRNAFINLHKSNYNKPFLLKVVFSLMYFLLPIASSFLTYIVLNILLLGLSNKYTLNTKDFILIFTPIASSLFITLVYHLKVTKYNPQDKNTMLPSYFLIFSLSFCSVFAILAKIFGLDISELKTIVNLTPAQVW